MEGFKTFILRGNLVELAVAFVMGVAFSDVVKAFTDMLMGFVGKIAGEPDFRRVELFDVNVGIFVNAVIAFVILAAVIYFLVVVPYNKAKERFFPTPEEPEGTPENIALLRDIRDALRSPSAGGQA